MDASSTSARASNADIVQGIKVIDIDSHLSEPLDLWTSRATPKYRDRVPQMRMLEGQWVWTIDGNRSLGVGSASPTATETLHHRQPARRSSPRHSSGQFQGATAAPSAGSRLRIVFLKPSSSVGCGYLGSAAAIADQGES
jgi:hypothetical protein